MTDRPEMFAPTRGFSGMADSVEPCTLYNVVGPTLVVMTTKFGQIWAIFDKIAYKSACMPHIPDMFGPTRGDD